MARIKSGSINQVFQWTLENVDEILESTNTLVSPNFYVYDNNGRQVKLTLQLNPIIENSERDIVSTIYMYSDQKLNFTWRWVSIFCSFQFCQKKIIKKF